jgi:hypothetical protein
LQWQDAAYKGKKRFWIGDSLLREIALAANV